MLDTAQLTAQLQLYQRVLVLCPRRSGQTTFLANYINQQSVNTVYLGLTGDQCREFAQQLTRPVPCRTGRRRPPDHIRQVPLLVVDEALFHNDRTLFTYFHGQRIVALSSYSPDPDDYALRQFAAAGFVIIHAPTL